ncbi:MAG TPA: 50S ribosomal protein L2 [Candidatus Nanoarchaeia archaeon]|nr:50S ribosomal protein L2 [Candidatus Nanoarchaeia archaeon]
MGKSLIQQKRGKGSPRYIAPSHRWAGESRYKNSGTIQGKIIEFVDCSGHSAPLARIRYEDGEEGLLVAVEGLCIGDVVGSQGTNGNAMMLQEIPEGTLVCNIELQPGDGGKFVRAGGTFAKVLARTPEGVVVRLPSKKEKVFFPGCRATIGIVAGGGRLEKPLLKAGKTFYAMQAKNKRWPLVSGNSMNAVSHPYGGKRKAHKGRPTIAPRNAPPGRNVGKLHPRRTGRRKR